MSRLAANKDLIQQFFVDERQAHRRVVVAAWIIVGLADFWGIGAYLGGVELFVILQGLIVFLALMMVCMWLGLHRKKTLQDRLNEVLDGIEFGWEEFHGLDLNEKEAGHLNLAFAATNVGRVSTNESYLRIRGTDAKGPAFDKSEAKIDPNLVRVDPLVHEADYAGLEGPLNTGEVLVEEANQTYASMAQERWEEAERADMDLVEAGVERLGDLVATDWFEKHAKDGAVADLTGSHEDS